LPIYTQVSRGRRVAGFNKLVALRAFHSTSNKLDYRVEIYEELVNGNIVIVDLHLGPEAVIRRMSESLASYLMERQTELFASGSALTRVQVILGDVDDLWSVHRYRDDPDVWVRLAKFSDSLNVGVLYSARDMTGLAHQVLAATRNWVVGH
jgi:hypothetical protein